MKSDYRIDETVCPHCKNSFPINVYEDYTNELICPYCKKVVIVDNQSRLKKYVIRFGKIIIGFLISAFVWYFIKLGIKWLDKYLGP